MKRRYAVMLEPDDAELDHPPMVQVWLWATDEDDARERAKGMLRLPEDYSASAVSGPAKHVDATHPDGEV